MTKFSIVIIVLVIAATFAVSSHLQPTFLIENISSTDVQLSAKWRDKIEDLGTISAGDIVDFGLNDEAIMTFVAVCPNGSEVIGAPIYFTSGVDIKVTISNHRIDVVYK